MLKTILSRSFLSTVFVSGTLLAQAASSDSSGLSPVAAKTLTSGADGSYLAADTQSNLLVNVAADATGATAPNVKFQVVDLGLGRVALKAGNGKVVSAAEDGAILKDMAGKEPGNAESFQWINLMRGDTALMSLVNHRYLATKPDKPGPVTATATGPSPARKNGECFKWKAVE